MAKKNLAARGPKKALVAKRAAIDKLVEASKKHLSNTIRSIKVNVNIQSSVQHPSAWKFEPPPGNRLRHPHLRVRLPEPKPVVPGLPEAGDYPCLVLDLRSEDDPNTPLTRLPCEPPIPRPLRDRAQGVFPFLELPGELRNKIYDYAIVKERYAIEWLSSNHKSKSLTYRLSKFGKVIDPPLLQDVAQRRWELNHRRGPPNHQHLAAECIGPSRTSLLLVCKQMSKEAGSMFYSKSSFQFRSLGTLRYFLDHLTANSKQSITKLSLKYRAYGNPTRTVDQRWKAKHDSCWADLCWRITDECTSLTHLALDLTLNKSPVSFVPFSEAHLADIGVQWILPLWAFQDAGIKRCWGRIRCPAKDGCVLEVESWKMRKQILGEYWNEEAEANRTAYGFEKAKHERREFKKGMVLRLREDGGVECID